MGKTNSHEGAVRSVVGFAREVRIHMRDERIIFGTVAVVPKPLVESFAIRPWGLTELLTIAYDAVLRAVPVKQMSWEKQRLIAAAQLAGTFAGPSHPPKRRPEPPIAHALAPSPIVTEVTPVS